MADNSAYARAVRDSQSRSSTAPFHYPAQTVSNILPPYGYDTPQRLSPEVRTRSSYIPYYRQQTRAEQIQAGHHLLLSSAPSPLPLHQAALSVEQTLDPCLLSARQSRSPRHDHHKTSSRISNASWIETSTSPEPAITGSLQYLPPDEPAPPGNLHWLLRCPHVFWEMMQLYLDDRDYDALRTTRLQFCVEQDRFLPWLAKYGRTCQRELENPRCRPENSPKVLACFHCFQLKPAQDFQLIDTQYGMAKVLCLRSPSRASPQRYYKPIPNPEPTATSDNGTCEASSRRSSMSVLSTTSSSLSGLLNPPPPPQQQQQQQQTSSTTLIRSTMTTNEGRRYIEGAPEGQIESLRRYCIECAMRTCLSVPGDLITTEAGKTNVYICYCYKARDQVLFPSCPVCGMNQVLSRKRER